MRTWTRKAAATAAALAAALTVGGCGLLGDDGGGAGAGAAGAPSVAPTWLVVANGSATPSPAPRRGGTAAGLPPLPSLPPPPGPDCGFGWHVGEVLIPLTVRSGPGALTVRWPRRHGSTYRVTAVPQPLRSGEQPPHPWRTVTATSGCTATATLTGLRRGVPHVVWLDAPGSGHDVDGTRHPYSGRSGVVYPG